VKEVKRFEDKTSEEIQDDMKRKRNKQFQAMAKLRKYQMITLVTCATFYWFGYRQFLQPRSIHNGVVYHQALRYLRKHKKVQEVLGDEFQVMNCNGKARPYSKTINFELVAFGDKGRGKFQI